MAEQTYEIRRFHQDKPTEVVKTGLTLEEAQAHCRQEDTKGYDWFDGYAEETTLQPGRSVLDGEDRRGGMGLT